jgi:hypothetical protein
VIKQRAIQWSPEQVEKCSEGPASGLFVSMESRFDRVAEVEVAEVADVEREDEVSRAEALWVLAVGM